MATHQVESFLCFLAGSTATRATSCRTATLKFIETARHPPSRATVLRLLGVPELKLSWADVPGPIAPPREPTGEVLPLEQTIGSFTAEQAQRLYTAETERITRFGTPMQAQTHRGSLKTSKQFFRWAAERKYIPLSPFAKVRPMGIPNAGKKQLRIDESRRLTQLLVIGCEKGEEGAIAGLCQLLLGLRSGEVISREVRDLDDEGRVLWIPSGKTKNARRRLEVPELLRPFLLRQVAGKNPEQRIFGTQRPEPFRYIWLWNQVKKYCQRANLPRVCPHSLRGLPPPGPGRWMHVKRRRLSAGPWQLRDHRQALRRSRYAAKQRRPPSRQRLDICCHARR